MDLAPTLAAELRRTAQRHPHVAAFRFRGRDVSFAQWDAAADRVARALIAAGLRRGDRLVLLLPPVPEYMFLYLGAARIGAITAGISTRYRRQEIGSILTNAAPRLVITAERDGEVNFADLIEEHRGSVPELERVVRFGTELEAFLDAGAAVGDELDAREASVSGRDPLAIVYTSGTTGPPKGAVYDSDAMIALTRMFSTRLPAPPAPGVPNLWPGMSLTHVGAMVRVHIHLAHASTMVLHDRFDADWCIEQIVRYRPERVGGFPPVLVMLVRSPAFARHDFSFVKMVTFGGAPLAPHLVEEVKTALGAEVFSGYSCTETAIISATLPGDSLERLRTTVGKPTAGVRVRIVDAERNSLPIGEPGRIAVHSPASMREYWRNPEATARALDAEGWLYTEDMGFLDAEGYLHLIGREKEMYFRAAFNVYPGEIEAVLQNHPKVAEAAVVGLPDDVLGEKGWAFVVPVDAQDPPQLEELRAFVGCELASYKRPDGLTLVRELPRNAMYKVDKRRLRDEYAPK